MSIAHRSTCIVGFAALLDELFEHPAQQIPVPLELYI